MHSEMQQHTLVFFGMPHKLGKPNNNVHKDKTYNKMIFTQEAPLTCVGSNWNLEKLIMIIIIIVTIMTIMKDTRKQK